MTEVRVTASRSYTVKIGNGLLDRLGAETAGLGRAKTAALISDDTVFALYGARAAESLKAAGLRVVSFTFPHGEESKGLETFARMLNFLAESRLTRSDIVVALGGGVTGDMAGFASACYLRGIRFVQAPTTLLAMVDSSVGGKTAVDLEAGKNLCGAFWQPSLVLCDCDALSTLPEQIFYDGCAEVIKYGMLGSAALLQLLREREIRSDIVSVISACVSMKRDIVAEDEFDTGRRQLLNFGHTVGHAVEACSGFALSHGQSVAIGMAIVTRAAVGRGICGRDTLDTLLALLEKYHLPSKTDYDAERLFEVGLSDKKISGASLNLIVPEAMGRCAVRTVPAQELLNWIRQGI